MKSKRARETAEVDEKPVSIDVEAPAKKRKREDDGADVKKAKKEKRDKKFKKESRKERKEKRKDLQDLPEQDDDVEDAQDTPMAGADDKPADVTADAEKSAKKEKKKEKKAKVEVEEPKDASADAEPKDESKKSKKKNKKQKSAETTTNGESANAEATAENTNGKADRHIVFVGNLPFTATAETIKAHFASLDPVGVRCMSDPKDSKPCRGFAFVEFAKVWHMRTCLDKFHHSEFTDGTSYPRRINVELTAGGGGKTKQRQEKIKEKNVKLNENRAKRIERERIAKEESSKANADRRPAGDDGIHPSRRAHIPGKR